MNETTNLNSELLSADARGRKHIPFAVFAVILIHVILFLVLLIAAGCRAKARARLSVPQEPQLAEQRAVASISQPPTEAATNRAAPTVLLSEPVVASEPPPERVASQPALRKPAQKSTALLNGHPAAGGSRKGKFYVVKAGDTVEKIAKMHRTSVEAIKAENNLKDHLLHPGQQLRVGREKAKSSNEV